MHAVIIAAPPSRTREADTQEGPGRDHIIRRRCITYVLSGPPTRAWSDEFSLSFSGSFAKATPVCPVYQSVAGQVRISRYSQMFPCRARATHQILILEAANRPTPQ
jgi:hypothetical protein